MSQGNLGPPTQVVPSGVDPQSSRGSHLLPVGTRAAGSAATLRYRGLGAVAMFAVGIGLVTGIESFQPAAGNGAPVTAPIQMAGPAKAVTDAPAPDLPFDPPSTTIESRRGQPVVTAGESRARTASRPPARRTAASARQDPTPLNRLFRPAGKFLTTTLPRVLGVKLVPDTPKRRPARRSRPT